MGIYLLKYKYIICKIFKHNEINKNASKIFSIWDEHGNNIPHFSLNIFVLENIETIAEERVTKIKYFYLKGDSINRLEKNKSFIKGVTEYHDMYSKWCLS